jgi:pilus assembly protein CpaE
MLRGVIICPDQQLADSLQSAAESQRVAIIRRLPRYPNELDLVRFLRAAAPEVVFLSLETRAQALDVAARIAAQAPGTQVVAVHRICDPAILLDAMRAGIREFLAPPFEPGPLGETVSRLTEAIARRPPQIEATDSVYAFLPAKPGVGATTLAVNTSLALASLPDVNVLLADFDLTCGLAGFMLRAEPQFSVVDAAENALNMDENLWPKLVTSVGKLDLLPAGKLNPDFRIESAQLRHLLEFTRRNYRIICADLSGLMEKYSLEILHEAKRIFLVVTPEIPSLHLARERLSYLRSLELGDRVALLLNRSEKRHLSSSEEIEQLFGLPLYMAFPNDYAGVHRALTAGKGVSPSSELGKCFERLAKQLTGGSSAPAQQKPGLLSFFSSRKKSLATAPVNGTLHAEGDRRESFAL